MILHAAGFGRYVYVVGSNNQVARFSGVRVSRVRLTIFTMSSLVAALAGVLLAARLGAVRGSTAEGFELDIITIVLLGGVSIFGGRGTMSGVFLSILLILNLRNGLGLANVTGNTQTGVIGAAPDPVGADAEPRRGGPIALHAGRRRARDITGYDPGGGATCRMSWLAGHPRPRVEVEETP